MILGRYPAGTRWLSQGKNPQKTPQKKTDDDLDDFSCRLG